MARKKTAVFEQSLDELEQLVQKMDSGELSLEDSLTAFEKGIGLIRDCQQSLQNAEQKIQTLIEKNTELELVDFDDSHE